MFSKYWMRTPAAADAIRAMVKAAPEAHVGAGTLLRRDDVARAVDAGAAFGVAPGLDFSAGWSGASGGTSFLPGVSTASEVMQAMEFGFAELKLFPAQGRAGVAWLQAMAGVFPSVTFCPTGGIKPGDVPSYLALPNCSTVGCSWVAPVDLGARTRSAGSPHWPPRPPRSSPFDREQRQGSHEAKQTPRSPSVRSATLHASRRTGAVAAGQSARFRDVPSRRWDGAFRRLRLCSLGGSAQIWARASAMMNCGAMRHSLAAEGLGTDGLHSVPVDS